MKSKMIMKRIRKNMLMMILKKSIKILNLNHETLKNNKNSQRRRKNNNRSNLEIICCCVMPSNGIMLPNHQKES